MAYLTIEIDQKVIAERELTDTVVVGRSPDCDVHVASKFLSRRHLRLERLADGWRAVDLESTNGSKIDGQPIAVHILDDGDEIRVENVTLIFREHSAEAQLLAGSNSDRIAEDEILDILNQRDDDSVDELPTEPALETPVVQKALEAPVEQKAQILPTPAAAAPPTRQERSRSLWQMASSPTPVDAKPAIVVVAANSAPRATQETKQRDLLWFWANAQGNPRFKKVGIAVGLAASLALVGYLWMSGPSSPHYSVRPLTVTPTHTPGRNPLADIPV